MNVWRDTPWKLWNELRRWLVYPPARLLFAFYGVAWGRGWRLHGLPILQRHRGSTLIVGDGLGLRSTPGSNPLSPAHPVVLCTWRAGARLEIGKNFAMTGGVLCAAQNIRIGDNVTVGANCTIIDTDFHPLDPHQRQAAPNEAAAAPVVIDDEVFIGMHSLVLKGVTIGRGSVIGAGSVVTRDVPPCVIAAGNPARVLGLPAAGQPAAEPPEAR